MFELPTLRPGIDPTLPADLKQLKKWIKQGEGQQVAVSIRRIYDTLKGLNRAQLTDKSRFAMFEMMAKPIADTVSKLEHHYIGLDQPLPLSNRKIALSLGRLIREYSYGYLRLVEASSALQTRFDRFGIHALAHNRVMKLCGELMMIHYRAYLSLPSGVWRDMHQTYQQAKSLFIHQELSADDHDKRTVEEEYLVALLCDLVDPYRLAVGEADLVRAYVCEHLMLCSIEGVAKNKSMAGQMVVHFDMDIGAYEASDIALRKDEDGFLLNTSLLARLVRQQLLDPVNRTNDEVERNQLKKHVAMLRCLVAALLPRTSENRKHKRNSVKSEMWVLRGLDAVHKHFAAASVEMDSILSLEMVSNGECSVDVAQPWASPMHQWRLSNESEGGFAMVLESARREKISIGDLLATASSPDGPWQTSVVKRVRYRSDEELVVGMEKLVGHADAVMVSASSAPDVNLQGLLHRKKAKGGEYVSLLLPWGPWQSGDFVTLEKVGALQLGKLLEIAGEFELFAVTAC